MLGYTYTGEKFYDAVKFARKLGVSVIGIDMPDGKVKNFNIALPYETMRKTWLISLVRTCR